MLFAFKKTMKTMPSITYPENEKEKLLALGALFDDWHSCFVSGGESLTNQVADDMVFDGFHPNYFSQKTKILFVGREALQIAGENSIDLIYQVYRDGKRVGAQHLNQHLFHSRMLYIAYGILRGMPELKEIPYASEIGDYFASPEGISFAFMNISKMSNESESWQADWSAINAAHSISSQGRKFNEEEIALLEPDVVITMNLGEKISSLGELKSLNGLDCMPRVFELSSRGHRSLLIDTWHFSAPKKDSILEYYVPICNLLRQFGPDFGLKFE